MDSVTKLVVLVSLFDRTNLHQQLVELVVRTSLYSLDLLELLARIDLLLQLQVKLIQRDQWTSLQLLEQPVRTWRVDLLLKLAGDFTSQILQSLPLVEFANFKHFQIILPTFL